MYITLNIYLRFEDQYKLPLQSSVYPYSVPYTPYTSYTHTAYTPTKGLYPDDSMMGTSKVIYIACGHVGYPFLFTFSLLEIDCCFRIFQS